MERSTVYSYKLDDYQMCKEYSEYKNNIQIKLPTRYTMEIELAVLPEHGICMRNAQPRFVVGSLDPISVFAPDALQIDFLL